MATGMNDNLAEDPPTNGRAAPTPSRTAAPRDNAAVR